jgi:hypothetical protein
MSGADPSELLVSDAEREQSVVELRHISRTAG